MEENLMDSTCLDSNGGVSLKQNSKSISVQTTISSSDNGCFDCDICLESAHDPVVTLCGHLYCWPCIYRWLHIQNQQQTCPVCKADISHTSLIPLYGRGTSNSDSEAKKLHMGGIPSRPPPYSLNAMSTSTHASASHPSQQLHPNYFQSLSQPFHYQQYFPHFYGGYGANGLPYLWGAAITSFFNPTIGMFREMVLTRMFRISDANLYAYSHGLDNESGSPRMRRQEMQIDSQMIHKPDGGDCELELGRVKKDSEKLFRPQFHESMVGSRKCSIARLSGRTLLRNVGF